MYTINIVILVKKFDWKEGYIDSIYVAMHCEMSTFLSREIIYALSPEDNAWLS